LPINQARPFVGGVGCNESSLRSDEMEIDTWAAQGTNTVTKGMIAPSVSSSGTQCADKCFFIPEKKSF
jgi:hypothetical protein